MKCSICSSKISTTFLEKIVGTYIKDEKGKKHLVCHGCQQSLGNKENILERLQH